MNASQQKTTARRALWIVGAAVLLAGLLASGLPRLLDWARAVPPIHHSKTNVLMLTLCTLRADHLGSYGYERDVSPNIDRVATEGFRFERVLAQAPWTRASVAAIITGMFPRSLNIEDPENHENYRRLHDGFTTMAEIMKDHGYHTVGITANPNTAAVFNMDQGYDWYEDPGFLWGEADEKAQIWDSADVSHRFMTHLLDRPPSEKFFAHLLFIDVHAPRTHKLQTEPGDNFELPIREHHGTVDTYDLQVSFLDKNIGRLLDDLRDLGYADDLLLIINSDHGEGLRDHSWLDSGHSRLVYNSTIWVPWILHHPKLDPVAASLESMVQQIDMLPTILELLGIDGDATNGGLSAVAGRSRVADIRGSGASPLVESSFVRTQFLGADKAAVVTPDYKLILNFDHAKEMDARMIDKRNKKYYFPPAFELYRYRDDPLEAEDLYEEETPLADDLRRFYEEWETSFPPLVPSEGLRVPKAEAKRQIKALEALGYVGGD